jgi:hypothetical protein
MNNYIYQSRDGMMMLCELYTNYKIAGYHLQVLLYLMANIRKDSEIFVNSIDIATELGMDKRSIGTYLKKLIELKLLFYGTTLGINSPYVLHPKLGYKGNLENVDELIKKIEGVVYCD